MPDSREDLARKILAGIAGLTDAKSVQLLPVLYDPDAKLGPLIKRVDGLLKKKAQQQLSRKQVRSLGYTLEKIGLLAFQSLLGINSVKSYQSAGPQHDLVVKGIDELWASVCRTVNLADSSGILIEAKATSGKVGDKEFERLGNIVTHHLGKTIGLGVFLSVEGATGFPERGKKRSTTLRAARLTQAVVYYSAKKPIVVLDWEDIRTLNQAGALVILLERKVREIEEMAGLPTPLPSEPVSVLLPKHLAPLCRF